MEIKIGEILKEVEKRSKENMNSWLLSQSSKDYDKKRKTKFIGDCDFEIIIASQEKVEGFKYDLEWLLKRIESEYRIDAAYEILQLFLKRERNNKLYNDLKKEQHKLYNFNKPERIYKQLIKAAKNIIRSLPHEEDSNQNAKELKYLLELYIKEQQTGNNEYFYSHRLLKIKIFTKELFKEQLHHIMKKYGVKKIDLRYVLDHLT